MYNKKGDFGFPVYLIPSLVAFLFTILVFRIIFFTGNLFNNPNLIIRSEEYNDDSKIIVLLQSESITYPGRTIAEIIGMSYNGETRNDEIKKEILEISDIMQKMPRPEKGNWIFRAEADGNIFLEVGAESLAGSKYFLQSAFIPVGNKKSAKVTLYLDCACREDELNAVQ